MVLIDGDPSVWMTSTPNCWSDRAKLACFVYIIQDKQSIRTWSPPQQKWVLILTCSSMSKVWGMVTERGMRGWRARVLEVKSKISWEVKRRPCVSWWDALDGAAAFFFMLLWLLLLLLLLWVCDLHFLSYLFIESIKVAQLKHISPSFDSRTESLRVNGWDHDT